MDESSFVRGLTRNSERRLTKNVSDFIFITSPLAAYHPGQLHSLPDRPLQSLVGGDAELPPHHAVARGARQHGSVTQSR